jgi:hypothetical protein
MKYEGERERERERERGVLPLALKTRYGAKAKGKQVLTFVPSQYPKGRKSKAMNSPLQPPGEQVHTLTLDFWSLGL